MDTKPLTFTAHLQVQGRVQGVGFRYFVQDEAESRGLSGWVRNCFDGTVEAILQGPKDLVEDMISEVRKGPPLSRVRDVHVEWEKPDPGLKGFEIKQ